MAKGKISCLSATRIVKKSCLGTRRIMQNMIKVMAVEYDAINNVDCGYWNGWLSLSEIDIVAQL